MFVYPAWLVSGVPALVCLLAKAAAYPAGRAARGEPIEALRQR